MPKVPRPTTGTHTVPVSGVSAGKALFMPDGWKLPDVSSPPLPTIAAPPGVRLLMALPGGTLDPRSIAKYRAPLAIPPAMPLSGRVQHRGKKAVDEYEIAVRQLAQQVLPPGWPMTAVWSYGSPQRPGTVDRGGSFSYPAFTIEARYGRPVRIRWIHGLTTVTTYPNDRRAPNPWYRDHRPGPARLNARAGPTGFYLLRGGQDDEVVGRLPGPAPAQGDPQGVAYYEIPILIEDRSFDADGSLFYPDQSGAWPSTFLGNTMVVNGRTWPYHQVEPRRYRLRFLNGCRTRALVLRFGNGLPFCQIGTEGRFLPRPVQLDELHLPPAARADAIADFTGLPVGAEVILLNAGPDKPYKGGVSGIDYDPADPATTGQVMLFRVVPATSTDLSTPPMDLRLP